MEASSGYAAKNALSVCPYACACVTSIQAHFACLTPPLMQYEKPECSSTGVKKEPAGASRYSMLATLFHALSFTVSPAEVETWKYPASAYWP